MNGLLLVASSTLAPMGAFAHQGAYVGIGAGQAEFSSDLSSDKWMADVRKQAGIDPTLTTNFNNSSNDDTSTAWKIYAGYDFSESWAIEAFYADFGEVDAEAGWGGTGAARSPDPLLNVEGLFEGSASANGKANAQAFGISGIGKIPVTNWFRAFAKLGGFYYQSELKTNWNVAGNWQSVGLVGPNDRPYNRNGGLDETTNGFSWLFGFGVGFTIAEHIGINVEWESFQDLKNDYPEGGSDSYDVNLVSASIDYKF